jgi:Ca2+-binding RTX toxin-like protein
VDGTRVGSDGVFTTPAAPAVTTGAAGDVGTTSARVACSVDPNGLATTWLVEYGATNAYGMQTSTQGAGSGTSAQVHATTLTGLKVATTYHYRCVATSAAGTTRGGDATFGTAQPPAVATGSASSVSSSRATVSGTINPHGRATTFYFEYGTTRAYGSKTAASSAGSGSSDVTVSKPIAGLRPGTLYHFRLVATSGGGSAAGADAGFTTLTAPTVATGAATAVGPAAATVSGTVNPNGRSTSWWVEYGPTTAYGLRTSSRSVGSGTTPRGVSTTLTGLNPGTLYHYRIVASSSLGTSSGQDAAFSTVGPPTVVTGQVSFPALTPTSAVVTGAANPHGLATTAWFEYGRTPAFGLRTAPVSVGSGNGDAPVSATLSGLSPGVRYFFRVVATSSAGSATGAAKSFGTPATSTSAGRCTIVGTQGHDVLQGTPGRDVICALAGDDIVRGGGGNDVVVAGPGDDLVLGGDGRDVLQGGLGTDVLRGGADADRLDGGAGRDQLLGGAGRDVILGGPGRDSIAAQDRRRDVVDGGAGFDLATIDRRLDRVESVERRRDR